MYYLLGFFVFAGVLDEEGTGARELTTAYSPSQLQVLRMNITSRTEVDSAVKQIEESGRPLWAVVNNAGVAVSVPWDWGDDVEEWRKVMEINTLGTIRVAKRSVHLLRKSGGRIVNVASAASRLVGSHIAHYSVSKFAVRAFSDAIRRDALFQESDNLTVVTIEPAFYRTDIVKEAALARSLERIKASTPPEIMAHYEGGVADFSEKKEEFARVHQNVMDFMETFMHEEVGEVVEAMLRAVTLVQPKPYIRCTGLLSYVFFWLAAYFPEIIVDFVLLTLLTFKKSW